MIRLSAAILAIALLATGTLARAPATPSIALRNAEDMAPLPGGRWVIASSMAGGPARSGALYAIDARTGRATRVYPDPTSPRTYETPGCGREVPADVFTPHGIAFRPEAGSYGTLYVVNHGGRESIEIFSLRPGATATLPPRLRWDDCTRAPKGQLQNAVAPTRDGTLYVTLTPMPEPAGDLEDHAEHAIGAVWSWHPARGWRPVPGSEMAGPNGIIATPDGRRLYVAAWPSGEIVELSLGADGATRRTLLPGFLPDNLRWNGDGTILAAGHLGNVADVVRCYVSIQGECVIPSAIAAIDPVSFTVRCSRSTGLSLATVAAPVGRELWIGTARGTRILRLPAASLLGARCR
jgi:sugar lactone lactonase YvrE